MGNKLYVGNLPYQVRDSDLEQAFSQFGQVTSAKVMMERETGRSKGFGFVEMGSDAEAQKLSLTLDRVNALLARLDGMAAKADTQVLGPDGVVQHSRATVVQLNALLSEARGTLKKVDGVLAEAQAVASNAREATTDLGALRSEVDSTVRKVEQLVEEVNRKWPFARDTELKLK